MSRSARNEIALAAGIEHQQVRVVQRAKRVKRIGSRHPEGRRDLVRSHGPRMLGELAVHVHPQLVQVDRHSKHGNHGAAWRQPRSSSRMAVMSRAVARSTGMRAAATSRPAIGTVMSISR